MSDGQASDLRVGVTGPADLALVDALARLHLAARRSGAVVRVQAGGELAGLLALCGLGGEPDRQPEVDEQLGADEVVDVGDAPA